jgi:hypothetical protein
MLADMTRPMALAGFHHPALRVFPAAASLFFALLLPAMAAEAPPDFAQKRAQALTLALELKPPQTAAVMRAFRADEAARAASRSKTNDFDALVNHARRRHEELVVLVLAVLDPAQVSRYRPILDQWGRLGDDDLGLLEWLNFDSIIEEKLVVLVSGVRARFPAGSPQGGQRCQAAWEAMNQQVFAILDESQRRRYEAMMKKIEAASKQRAGAAAGESLSQDTLRPSEATGRSGRRTRAS